MNLGPFGALSDRITPEPNSGCWLWLGYAEQGYGRVTIKGKRSPTHRVVYEEFRGPIPPGLELDHLCRVPCCVNPDHLEPVTPQINQLRGFSPTGINARKTHCVHGHPLTEGNVWVSALGSRHCILCRRRYNSEFKKRKRQARRAARTLSGAQS